MKYITLLVLTMGTFCTNAQSTYWKYEKTIPVLVTAADTEAFVDLFTEDDYIQHSSNMNKVILYMFENDMKAYDLNTKTENISKSRMISYLNLFDYKYEITGNTLKLLMRADVDNIYFIIFKKLSISKEEFSDRIEQLKG